LLLFTICFATIHRRTHLLTCKILASLNVLASRCITEMKVNTVVKDHQVPIV
jgi:hypothetical protein